MEPTAAALQVLEHSPTRKEVATFPAARSAGWHKHLRVQEVVMLVLAPVALATALALIRLGGGLYEYRVVDPAWPRRPDIHSTSSRWHFPRGFGYRPMSPSRRRSSPLSSQHGRRQTSAAGFCLALPAMSRCGFGRRSTSFPRLSPLSAQIPRRSLKTRRAAGRVAAVGGSRSISRRAERCWPRSPPRLAREPSFAVANEPGDRDP